MSIVAKVQCIGIFLVCATVLWIGDQPLSGLGPKVAGTGMVHLWGTSNSDPWSDQGNMVEMGLIRDGEWQVGSSSSSLVDTMLQVSSNSAVVSSVDALTMQLLKEEGEKLAACAATAPTKPVTADNAADVHKWLALLKDTVVHHRMLFLTMTSSYQETIRACQEDLKEAGQSIRILMVMR